LRRAALLPNHVGVHDDNLISRLEVEPISEGVFESSLEGFEGRSFGGEILSKAVTAALRTCADRRLHSLHAYFLRPAPPDRTLHFAVHVLRDGRRLSSRRVEVWLDGRFIAEVSMSLAAAGEGPAFEQNPHPLDLPGPDELPTLAELAAKEGWPPGPPRPLDWRYLEHLWHPAPAGDAGRWRAWIKPLVALPEASRFHDAALAYLSDHGSLGVLQRRFGESFDWNASSSLDQALWIHGPFRWTDWVLMDTHSEIAVAGRALTERRIYAADGTRIASVAQEGLFNART